MKVRTAKYLKFGTILFVILLLITGISAEYTSRSSFCNSCHYMEPFYEAWEVSHHNDVDCITCHYPPTWNAKIEGKFRGLIQLVNYVGQTYKRSKPWAEIPDASCLQSGCHETRLLVGDVAFQKVVFDHTEHLGDLKRGKELRCTSCHSQIVQGDHIQVTESTCFICHFKEKTQEQIIASCETCHDWETVIRAGQMNEYSYDHTEIHRAEKECIQCHTNVIVGDGAVPMENCYQCHFERDRLNLYDNTELMHVKHISENKIECMNCHLAIQHKVQQMTSAGGVRECTSCHSDFHQAQLYLFAGTGGIDAEHIPNPMYEIGLSCKGCHIFHEEYVTKGKLAGETDLAESKSCEQCHGTGYDRILQGWREVTENHLNEINKIYAQINNKLQKEKTATDRMSRAEQLFNDASINIEIVQTGKNVHNVKYSDELLDIAYIKLTQAAEILNVEYEPLSSIDRDKVVPSECSNCHFGIEVKERTIFGLTFKHEVHVAENKFKCNLCHSNIRRHGELYVTKNDCADCHHTNESVDCQHCHVLQRSIIAGAPAFYDREVLGVMSDLGEDCLFCHEVEEKRVKRPVRETCVGCHDEGYDDLLIEWKNEATYLIQSLETAIDERLRQPAGLDKSQLETMKEWLNYFRLDGSNSVHNRELFEDAVQRIQEYIKTEKNKKIN